jgi:DNA-binding GntR family transcriptional regulator
MPVPLADQAYKALKNDIITCLLEPGEQIVQTQISNGYGFGATPVREALQRLAQEGFVEAIRRLGYVVTPITFRDVREVYELRLIIESAATRLAAKRGSKEQLSRLLEDSQFSYVYGDRESYTQFLSQNMDFHRSVAAAAGNERMVNSLSGLLDEMTRIFHLGLNVRDSAREMRDEHIALSEALLKRDADGAERIVRNQIETSQARVLEALTHYRGFDVQRSPDVTIAFQPSGESAREENA